MLYKNICNNTYYKGDFTTLCAVVGLLPLLGFKNTSLYFLQGSLPYADEVRDRGDSVPCDPDVQGRGRIPTIIQDKACMQSSIENFIIARKLS